MHHAMRRCPCIVFLLDNWHGLWWCEKKNYTSDSFSLIILFGFVGYDAFCDLGWGFEVRLSENLL